MSSRVAESEYARVMATRGPERTQGLVKLVRTYVDFAPAWASLAEEHWSGRRREEALTAARRALAIDPSLHQGFSLDLKMATRQLLAQIAPKAPTRATPAGASADSRHEPSPVALANRQMLHTALGLQDREERIALLEELEALAPSDPDVLFHLAKELAVVGRMEDARRTGEQLNRWAPERYIELYAWAEKHLASARTSTAASATPSPTPPAPAQTSSDHPPALGEHHSVLIVDNERMFDEAATVDFALDSSSMSELYDEEVTTRAAFASLKQGADMGGADGKTARLDISELEHLVAVSMDPDLDS